MNQNQINNFKKYFFIIISFSFPVIYLKVMVTLCYEEWVGIQATKIEALAFIINFIPLAILYSLTAIISIGVLIYSLIKKNRKWKFYLSYTLLHLIVLVVPLAFSFLPPYENIAFNKVMANKSKPIFNDLFYEIELQKHSIDYISVLTRQEYVIFNNIVINLKKNAYGEIPEPLFPKTFNDYYIAASTQNFSDLDIILDKYNYEIKSATFNKIYNLMKKKRNY